MEFVRKVYGITSFQIAITVIITFIFSTIFSLYHCLIVKLSLSGLITTTCILCYNKRTRSHIPKNYILFSLLSLFESTILTYPVISIKILIQAMILSIGIFMLLTGYAMKTKYDFTNYVWITHNLIAGLAITALIGYGNIIVGTLAGCVYILYDAQIICGRGGIQYVVDEYILASMNVYLDFIILYSKILKLLVELSV